MIALIINIAIVLTNAFYAIAKKRENKILLFISFLFLFLLMGGYRGSYSTMGLSRDMYNYFHVFELIKNGGDISFIEPGYKLLVLLFTKVFKVDFLTFYAIIHFLCLFIIFKIGKKYAINRHVVITLFSLFMHIYSCEQFQNYIAVVIATMALCHLIYREKEGIDFNYIIGIIIAALFHYTIILFLVFILGDIKNKKSLIRGIILFSIVLCTIGMITGFRIDLNSILSSFTIIDQVASRYYTSAHLGWLYGVLLQSSTILVAYVNYRQIKSLSIDDKNKDLRTKVAIERLLWIDILGIVFFPIYMINTQIIRLARGLLLVNFIGCASIVSYLPLKKRTNIMIFYMLWCIAYGCIYFVFLNGTVESILLPFFQKNAFF